MSGDGAAAPRFGSGDRVRVLRENLGGNPRTPRYTRGKAGVVVTCHGEVVNPLDHRGVYPPLYTIVFDVADLFGGDSRDVVAVDVHEDWLEPAGNR